MNHFAKIIEAKVLCGTRFYVRFEDGVCGELDYRNFNTNGQAAKLLDPKYFKLMKIDEELGSLIWPNGVDICRDYLYEILHNSQNNNS